MGETEGRQYSTFFQKIHYSTDLKLFSKISFSLADEILAVSQYTAEHIRKEIGLKKNIQVIYNGIDTGYFRPVPVSATNDSRIRVLFSGNLSKRKGAQWLPAIADRLKEGIVIRYTCGLRRTKANIDHRRIEEAGYIDEREMPYLYSSHDILLSPAVREGFGLAVAEAMACGLPVVASNCSAIPELIDHEKGGFLCDVGDVSAFAERINQLSESKELRKEMGEYNRKKIEKLFTIDKMVKNYAKIFDKYL